MASTRAQQGALLTDPTFLAQMTGSLLAMAYAVITEPVGTANHVNRVLFANAIIGTPSYQAKYMMPGVIPAANIIAAAGTPASIADADVDARVVFVFNFYANQFAAQLNSGVILTLGG